MNETINDSNSKRNKKTCVYFILMIIYLIICICVFVFVFDYFIPSLSKDNKSSTTTVTSRIINKSNKDTAATTLAIKTSTTKINSCPIEWVFHDGNCYKVEDSKMRFSQAAIYCRLQNKGSYLAEISSDDEFEWIRMNFSNKSVWVNGTENII